MQRILDYALEYGYTKYTSTLKEAWRLSISGISKSLIDAADKYDQPPELYAEAEIHDNSIALFGITEAILHRNRGISLQMFLSLFKYYRQSYIDLIEDISFEEKDKEKAVYFTHRVFDIMETGLCVEWAGGEKETRIFDLQIKNREMTNEKNKYLTIFESHPTPVFLLSADAKIDNINHAAAKYFDKDSVAGGLYYSPSTKAESSSQNSLDLSGKEIIDILPWLTTEIVDFYEKNDKEYVCEKEIFIGNSQSIYQVKLARMLDVSKKFNGVVLILEDITKLKKALSEVKTLKGLIPICSHCKKMRDDSGYWNRLEEYIESRSDALFSHSVCEDCLDKFYSG